MKKDAENYLHPRKIFNYFTTGNLLPIVEKILSKRNSFLALTKKYKTPFYAYDKECLDESIEQFTKAFQTHVPRFQAYYAMKLNHHSLREMGISLLRRKHLTPNNHDIVGE